MGDVGEHRQLQHPGQTGGEATGPISVDCGKLGIKYHLLVDPRGVLLAV
jgi:hypothetical protein